MTTLAQGSNVTLTVGDNGYVNIATNGGQATVSVTPTNGSTSSVSLGPYPERRKFGPYSEGASVNVVNQSCASLDYDYNAADGGVPPYLASSLMAGQDLRRALVAAYEQQRAIDERFGPMLLARAGLPVAADVPTVSFSTTAPSADVDVANQVLHPFVNDYVTSATEILAADLAVKSWSRGHSHVLRGFRQGRFFRLASTLNTYGVNGQQDIDPTTNYGQDTALVSNDVVLDGDVLFIGTRGTAGNADFELYVNGSLCAPTFGTNAAATSDARGVALSSGSDGYIKLKWGAVARRRITIMWRGIWSASVFYTRNTATLLPAIPEPITWVHLGDSFSQYTGATSYTIGLTNWMHAAFGCNFDFINIAQGSTGFNVGNLPGAVPTATKPSLRQQWLLNGSRCNPRIISMLVGHNDAAVSPSATALSEFTATLADITTRFPSALVLLFTTNASPGMISTGAATAIENAFKSIAASYANVQVFPLQTRNTGAFLRGTGKVGATTGDGNADTYVSSDGTHPSDAGHRALGEWMARLIYQRLRG